jgi:hypothetical protein
MCGIICDTTMLYYIFVSSFTLISSVLSCAVFFIIILVQLMKTKIVVFI